MVNRLMSKYLIVNEVHLRAQEPSLQDKIAVAFNFFSHDLSLLKRIMQIMPILQESDKVFCNWTTLKCIKTKWPTKENLL